MCPKKVTRRRGGGLGAFFDEPVDQPVPAASGPDLQYRNVRRRHVAAVILFVIAPLIAIAHFMEHFGLFRLLGPPWQDILLGYPMAGALLVIGGVTWGR